jgi:flagellar motor switch protein FliN/FliY
MKAWMQSNEETLTAILDTDVKITNPEVVENPSRVIYEKSGAESFIAFPIFLTGAVSGSFNLVVRAYDLGIIIDLMIGGNGSSPMEELDDMHLIVFVQAIKQMAVSLSQILEDNFGNKVEIRVEKPGDSTAPGLMDAKNIAAQFRIHVEPVMDTVFQILIPSMLSQEMVNQVQDGGNSRVGSFNQSGFETNTGQAPMLRKARFPSLGEQEAVEESENIDIMMDIPLQLTVVLGKTGINLKDLVELKSGSIFSLDKMAGEPVELYINDRFVGYGEVIVIDDNFGVRVIEVPSSAETGRGGGSGSGGGRRR